MSKTALFVNKDPGGIFSVEDLALSTGERIFVDDGGTDAAGYGKNPETPVATLDYAVGLATADQGDIIFVMPGHAEDLGADSAVDIDKAGLTIIGLGFGRNMPTFNATAIAGDFKMAAARTTIKNLRFTGGIDATTGILEISAADCAVLDCEYRDVTGQATDVVMTTAAADRLLIDGWKHFGAAAAGANSAIALVGLDDFELRNFYMYGNFAVGAVDVRTTAAVRLNIHDGKIWTANAADIGIVDTITGSTGFIGPNLFIMLKDHAANITEAVTGATFQVMDPVYVCNLAGEKGLLINWTASGDA